MKRMPPPLTTIIFTLKAMKLSGFQPLHSPPYQSWGHGINAIKLRNWLMAPSIRTGSPLIASPRPFLNLMALERGMAIKLMALTLTLILVGCSPIPTQEMSDARQALQAAREVQAQIYVPQQLEIAEQNLIQAERHLAQTQFEQARLVAILAKKQALNTYQLATTLARAQTVWQAVADITAAPTAGKKFLKPAQLAAQENNVAKTIALAKIAYQQGQLALNQAQLKQAKLLITKIKLQKQSLAPEALTRLRLAEEASRQGDGQQAYNLVKSLLEPNQ